MKRKEPCVEALIPELFGVIISLDNDIVPARLAKYCARLEPYSWPMPGMADFISASAHDYRLVLLRPGPVNR